MLGGYGMMVLMDQTGWFVILPAPGGDRLDWQRLTHQSTCQEFLLWSIVASLPNPHSTL
jgi:hypothetical protein